MALTPYMRQLEGGDLRGPNPAQATEPKAIDVTALLHVLHPFSIKAMMVGVRTSELGQERGVGIPSLPRTMDDGRHVLS